MVDPTFRRLYSRFQQVFWNLSEKSHNSYDCFGNPEADDLCDVLTEFLDADIALGAEPSVGKNSALGWQKTHLKKKNQF